MPESHREEIAKLEALYAGNPGGRVFVHLAEALRKGGEHERARNILTEGLARHPDSASGHVVLGRVLTDTGATREAEQAFRRVLELDGGNLVALRCLGDLARAEGRTDEAVGLYREVIARSPASGDVAELIRQLERERAESGARAPTQPAASVELSAAGQVEREPPRSEDAVAPAPDVDWREQPVPVEAEDEPVSATAAPGQAGAVEPAEPLFEELDLSVLAADETDVEPGGAEEALDLTELDDLGVQLLESAAEPYQLDDLEDELAAAPLEVHLLDAAPELEGLTGEAPDAGGTDAAEADMVAADEPGPATAAFDAWLDVGTEAGSDEDAVELIELGRPAEEATSATDEEPPAEFSVPELEPAAYEEEAEADLEEINLGAPPEEEGVPPGIEAVAGDIMGQLVDASLGTAGDEEYPEDVGFEEFTLEAALGETDLDDADRPEADAVVEEDVEEWVAAGRDEPVTAVPVEAAAAEPLEGGEAEPLDAAAAEPPPPGESQIESAPPEDWQTESAPPEDWQTESAPPEEWRAGLAPADDGQAAPAQEEWQAARAPEEWRAGPAAVPSADVGPTDLEPGELVTETMAELYRMQGFPQRAADVYRALLRQRPDDERLRARLREIEAALAPEMRRGDVAAAPATADVERLSAETAETAGWQPEETAAPGGTEAVSGAGEEAAAAGAEPTSPTDPAAPPQDTMEPDLDEAGEVWLRGVESAWTGGGGAAPTGATLYTWAEPPEHGEAAPPIGSYLQGLVGWHPAGEAEAAGGAAATEPGSVEEDVRVGTSASDSVLDTPAIPADESVEPWTAPEPEAEPWQQDEAPDPWADGATTAALPPAAQPDPWDAEPEPEGTAEVEESWTEPWATATDPVAAAFNEWFDGPAAAGAAESAAAASPAPEAPDAAAPDAADEDEDLETFRAWLQSLKK